MLRVLVCALFAAATAYPSRNYDDISRYLQQRVPSQRRDSIVNHVQQIEMETRKRCEQYGGDGAFEKFMAVVETSGQEMRSALFVQAQIAANKGETPNVGFYCRLTPTFKSMLKDVMEAAKNCVSPLQRNDVSEAINITNSALDYICYNEGQRIVSFVENGGVQCSTMIQDKLLGCLQESVGNLLDLDEPKDEAEKQLNREKECKIIYQIESCVKRQLFECQNPKVETFVEGVMDAIITPSCKKQNKH